MDESAKSVRKSGAIRKQKSRCSDDFQVSKQPPLSVLSDVAVRSAQESVAHAMEHRGLQLYSLKETTLAETERGSQTAS